MLTKVGQLYRSSDIPFSVYRRTWWHQLTAASVTAASPDGRTALLSNKYPIIIIIVVAVVGWLRRQRQVERSSVVCGLAGGGGAPVAGRARRRGGSSQVVQLVDVTASVRALCADMVVGAMPLPRPVTGVHRHHLNATTTVKAKVRYLLQRFLHESDSRPEALYNRCWLAWADDTAAHYAAIHCPRQRTIGPAVCS